MLSRIIVFVGFTAMAVLILSQKKGHLLDVLFPSIFLQIVGSYMFIADEPVMPYNDFLALEFAFIPPLLISLCGVRRWNAILLTIVLVIIIAMSVPSYQWMGISYVVGCAPLLITLFYSLGKKSRHKKILASIGTGICVGYLGILNLWSMVIYAIPYWIIANVIVIRLYGQGTRRDENVEIGGEFKFEMRRKFTHLLAVLFVIVPFTAEPLSFFIDAELRAINVVPERLEYYLNNRELLMRSFLLFAISAFTIPIITLEMLRLSTTVEYPFSRLIASRMRPSEQFKLLASSEMVIGLLLASLFIPSHIQFQVILVPVIADAAGALVGKKYGKHKIKSKSLEGFAAEFIAAFLISLYLENVLTSILVGTLFVCIDLLTIYLPVGDNILYPPLIGAILTII
ncbi:MAG: hypothetical protein QXL15_01575 [Candidatus Korarchaeota archaeon]